MSLQFTGYYTRNFIVTNLTNGLSTVPAFLDKYPNATTLVVIESNRVDPMITAPNYPMFYEMYTWSTYSDDTLTTKLGEITYNSFYPDSGSGTITEPSIQTMTVLGADGIYENINQVVMDFTAAPIRIIGFINK